MTGSTATAVLAVITSVLLVFSGGPGIAYASPGFGFDADAPEGAGSTAEFTPARIGDAGGPSAGAAGDAPGPVTVYVSDAGGIPIPNAEVRLSRSRAEVASGTADGAGAFTATLPAGTYSVRAEADGYRAAREAVTVTGEGAIDLTLVRDGAGIERRPVPAGEAAAGSLRTAAAAPPPTADAGPDRTVRDGEAVTFDGSNSTGNVSAYRWHFGDGTSATGEVVDHAYAELGAFTVTLETTDPSGVVDADTANVTVLPGAPRIDVTAPADGAAIPGSDGAATVETSGTAADARGVAEVSVSVNGGPSAVLFSGDRTDVSWRGNVTLVRGFNTLRFSARDVDGVSDSVVYGVTYGASVGAGPTDDEGGDGPHGDDRPNGTDDGSTGAQESSFAGTPAVRTTVTTTSTGSTTRKTFRGYTGTGGSCLWPPSVHSVNIDLSDVNVSTVKSASLVVRAYDCDNPTTACNGRPEIDTVLLNGKQVGILTGASDQWSTVSFPVNKDDIVEGDNSVKIYIDTTGTGCWCLGVDWAELALEIEDVDLTVDSEDITVTRTGSGRLVDNYRMEAKVHNRGSTDAEDVQVRVKRTFLGRTFADEVVGVGTVPAGGTATVVRDFLARDIGNYEIQVTADPNDRIEETDENNNTGEIHTVSGKVVNDQNAPMKNMKVEYVQNNAVKWTTFTDAEGNYKFLANMDGIQDGVNGVVRARLEYSKERDGPVLFTFYSDTLWDAGRKETSHKDTASWKMDVSKDHAKGTLTFNWNEGGRVYTTVVEAYEYFRDYRKIGFNPPELQIEFLDDDYAQKTSYQSGNTLHMWHSQMDPEVCVISHEYSHRVSDPWGNPYNPIEENWANYGSSLARSDSFHPYDNKDIAKDADTNSIWYWQLAGVYWDLDRDNVVDTLKNTTPTTAEEFFENYLAQNSITDNATIIATKATFRRHGFNTTGWKGPGGVDPSVLTGRFTDRPVDTDGNGRYDALEVDVEVNISTTGEYFVYGDLAADAGGECFAINNSILTPGVQNVTLRFDGQCIARNRLDGNYLLTDLYWENHNASLFEHMASANETWNYTYTEFDGLLVSSTGNHNDTGIDADADGRYDALEVTVELNVSSPEVYSVSGDLFDGTGTYLATLETTENLSAGVRTVPLRMDGGLLNANGYDGAYEFRELVVKTEEGTGGKTAGAVAYEEPGVVHTTASYTASQFEAPGAVFGGGITESAPDADGDGFLDGLAVSTNVNVSDAGDYVVTAHLVDGFGTRVATAYNTTSPGPGVHPVSTVFEGTVISASGLDGPYQVDLYLQDANASNVAHYPVTTALDAANHTTSAYEHYEFEFFSENYLNTNYSDRGLDTDGDGLYDHLSVGVNVSTNGDATVRNHTLNLLLRDQAGTLVSHSIVSTPLNNHTRNVTFNVSGTDIWRTGNADQPYTVTLEVYRGTGNNTTLVSTLEDDYTTGNYSHDQFEPAGAGFAGSYADSGVDTDGDGLYNLLEVDVGLTVNVAGNYSVEGHLYDANGSTVASARNRTRLSNGSRSVALGFDGLAIRAHGADGPYALGSLALYDGNGTQIGFVPRAHDTAAYSPADFETVPITFTGNYSDFGVDADGDGTYDTLAVLVEVVADANSTYEINGRILDSAGREIDWGRNASFVAADRRTNLTLPFEGANIYANGADGPYTLDDLHVYDTAQPSRDNTAVRAHATAAYNYTDFRASGVVTGRVTDANGTAMVGTVVSLPGDSDTTNASGYYRVTVPSTGSYTVTAWGPFGSDFLDNATAVDATVGNVTRHDVTLQHEGRIHATVVTENATPVSGASAFLSGPTSGSNTSDAAGEFVVRELEAGTYSLTVSPPSGVNLLRNTTSVAVNYGETSDVTVTLPTGGVVTGNVTDGNGSAVASAHVSVSGPKFGSTFTDANGSFGIIALAGGNYTLSVSPPSGVNLLGNTTTVEVRQGENTTADVTLPTGGVIRGTVTDEAGDPVASNYVFASGPSFGSDFTDANGTFEIDRLTTGNYTVTANRNYGLNLYSNSTAARVVAGSVTAANVVLPPIPELSVGNDTTLPGGLLRMPDPEWDGAVIVTASNVTIDGNGTVLDGDGSGYGLRLDGVANVTIANLTLTNYSRGIYVTDAASGIAIENVTVRSVSYGAYMYRSNNGSVTNSSFRDGFIGVYLSRSRNNTIGGNDATGNTYGFYLTVSEDNVLSGNNASGNTGYNVYLSSSGGNEVSGNDLSGSDRSVLLSNSDRNGLFDNTLADNDVYGIYLSASDGNRLRGNGYRNNPLDLKLYRSINTSVRGDSFDGTVVDLDPAGDLEFRSVVSPPADPSGRANVGAYLDIRHTGGVTIPRVNLTVHYNASDAAGINETTLSMWRYNGTAWSEVPGSTVDAAANAVSANVTSFSVFAPLAAAPKAPDIAVTPASNDFGTVSVGADATRTVEVSNEGTATLNVTNASIVGANASEFSLADVDAFALAPGASATLAVTFAPTSAGSKTATLRVESNDTDEPGIDVALSGNATESVGVKGDANADGSVTSGDATIVLRRVVGLSVPASFDPVLADVNSDGSITSGDATLILRIVVGLPI